MAGFIDVKGVITIENWPDSILPIGKVKLSISWEEEDGYKGSLQWQVNPDAVTKRENYTDINVHMLGE